MLKKIYHIIPFKKELFSILKKIYVPSPGIYKHFHFKGIFNVNVKDHHNFKIMHYGHVIENELFWGGVYGGWEKISLQLWIKLCENANYIFDIGANTGLYSLIAKAINKNSEVYAYEPVERVFEKLKYNNWINSFNIHCSSYAISNKNGKAIIYDDPNAEHIYSVTVNKNMFSPEIPVVEKEIKTITLDTVIEKENINRIDLIKIDVETHEPEVLEGYAKYIKEHQPSILIEILNDEVGKKVESLVKNINYLYFNIDENKGIKKVDGISKSDYYNYLLCSEEVARNIGILADD